LPDNREIEEALRAYQSLFQGDSQPDIVRRLRESAVRLMSLLDEFSPYLVGSVLAGTASEHSDINLHLFCDSSKDVEIFLLNRDIPFDAGERRARLGDKLVEIPEIALEFEDVVATLSLFHTDDMRITPKHRADGRPVERARLAQVKALLEDGANPRAAPESHPEA
jgi:predicted nucleotidyltransferase